MEPLGSGAGAGAEGKGLLILVDALMSFLAVPNLIEPAAVMSACN